MRQHEVNRRPSCLLAVEVSFHPGTLNAPERLSGVDDCQVSRTLPYGTLEGPSGWRALELSSLN